jgi:lysozyme
MNKIIKFVVDIWKKYFQVKTESIESGERMMQEVKVYDTMLAVPFVGKWEGLKLTAYQCSAGVWTIGYGSTKGVTEGMVITEDEAEKRLAEDLQTAKDALVRLVKVPVSEGQFIALMSIIFNVGSGAISRSKLLKKLNEGDYNGSATEFLDFCYANGKRIQGLANRRQEEYDLFMADVK